jgi:hypothetical protein
MRWVAMVSLCMLSPWAADAQGVSVFFGNLHSHTSYSDGRDTPEEAYRHARDVARLDFLAVTEHNHSQAGRIANDHSLYNGATSVSLIQTANRFNVDGQFVALYGQEFSTIGSGNHANVFEVGEVIDTDDVPNGEWDDLLNTWIPAHLDSQGQPALVLLNHPATNDSPNIKEYGRDDFPTLDAWRTALDARAELINIINGPSHDQSSPASASEGEFQRYLDLGFHLAPTADQDNHRSNWGSAADTRTAVIAASLTKPDIMAALRARHVYATEDRNLRLIARVNGELIGTRFTGASVPPIGEFSISIEIRDDDEELATYTIDVFSGDVGGDADTDIVKTFTANGNGTFSFTGIPYTGGERYFFFRITQAHDDVAGQDRVWTAPVWFEPTGSLPSPPPPTVLTLDVDLQRETAVIANLGSQAADVSGWRLVSLRGNQTFDFPSPFQIAAGTSVTVVSGAGAAPNNPPSVLRWTTNSVWNNSGDPGQLRDASGTVVATDP